MGKSIFITYKYADAKVSKLPGVAGTTVRDYVNIIQEHLEKDHVNKGEDDGESMAALSDASIASKLGDKIFNSSVTIVLISKGMKENGMPEKDQWIPWEISYSLKEQSRNGRNSKTNAMLAVILPDENGSYEYFITEYPACKAENFHTERLFDILRLNMFNLKFRESFSHDCGGMKIYNCAHSYIYTARWSQFILNPDAFVNIAIGRQLHKENYDIVKTV